MMQIHTVTQPAEVEEVGDHPCREGLVVVVIPDSRLKEKFHLKNCSEHSLVAALLISLEEVLVSHSCHNSYADLSVRSFSRCVHMISVHVWRPSRLLTIRWSSSLYQPKCQPARESTPCLGSNVASHVPVAHRPYYMASRAVVDP